MRYFNVELFRCKVVSIHVQTIIVMKLEFFPKFKVKKQDVSFSLRTHD